MLYAFLYSLFILPTYISKTWQRSGAFVGRCALLEQMVALLGATWSRCQRRLSRRELLLFLRLSFSQTVI